MRKFYRRFKNTKITLKEMAKFDRLISELIVRVLRYDRDSSTLLGDEQARIVL